MTKQKSPIAFGLAFLLAPVLTTLVFYSFFTEPGKNIAAVIGFGAGIYGAPFYLIVGTPLVIGAYRQGKSTPVQLAAVAFTANLWTFLAAPLISVIFVVIYGSGEILGALKFGFLFAMFGCVFAPLWGGVFGLLYQLYLFVAARFAGPNTDPTL